MIAKILKAIVGTRNDRLVKQMRKTVLVINGFEEQLKKLSDEQLRAKTDEFKLKIKDGASLDQILPEAFAVVREASCRIMGMRHYDVQLIGGMVLHSGKISEMRTGEGKTLVATLAAYLNALSEKGVHVVTVNDYLARRDAQWMGRLYNFLGLTVGIVVPGQSQQEKHAAYRCDISYCTNNELGFDYLRDNMCFSIEDKAQRPLNFAIIDEVDSILIDEARTPLIISGPAEGSEDLYVQINALIPQLVKQTEENGPGDFFINEKDRQALLTEDGHVRAEDLLREAGLLEIGQSLYDANNLKLYHHLECCLKAHYLFLKDVAYIVREGEVVIVDEFTGRTLSGRRWSDGLHQAVEAKEQVKIQPENQTMASITFQNYFRIYTKLSGMTGTADTEAPEFLEIYNLEVVIVPTNQTQARTDYGDLIFLTQTEKYAAILKGIQDCYTRKQPVLVGTTSIEVSEIISYLLKKENISHEVLNAKQHEREALIVAYAGMPSAITIATNMAGRGTDIVLGGNLDMEISEAEGKSGTELTDAQKAELKAAWQVRHDEVKESGGLHIIGTERHESRRIDNQLRGRAGRQGDQGSSRFYLSLEDNLMRIFTNPSTYNMMKKLGMGDGVAIEHKWISRTIENAQRKVEGHNFEARKNLLQYDNVANDQRRIIYQQRNDILSADKVSNAIDVLRESVLSDLVRKYIPPMSMEEQWDIKGLEEILNKDFAMSVDIEEWLKEQEQLDDEHILQKVISFNKDNYDNKVAILDPIQVDDFEKSLLIQTLDNEWKDHLAAMDYLRQGINLRSYAQKRPEQEYKREAFAMFELMLEQIHYRTILVASKLQVQPMPPKHEEEDGNYAYNDPSLILSESSTDDTSIGNAINVRDMPALSELFNIERLLSSTGRNDSCPCGSGKKFKHCHGNLK
ncbi:preprotein translocase subunit [Gammaproteobacteria bacterium]|nr:preprotein translocase subunit [Gammaproteobacteria bacterium]